MRTALLCISLACFFSCQESETPDIKTKTNQNTNGLDANNDLTTQTDAGLDTRGDQSATEDVTIISDAADSAIDMPVEEERIPVIVAYGWQGLTSVSIDEGQTWCETGLMTDPHDDLFRGGTYHDGLFVGAHAGRDNRGAIITSTNGYDWKAQHRTNVEPDLTENPSGQWYGGVAYGNGTWLAVGGCGQMASSTDGESWVKVERFTDGCKHIRSLAFGDGRFVAGLDDLGWWESSDGQSWTQTDANAGSVAVWNGNDFEGQVDGNTLWRGRGLCMWGEGWDTNAKIMRSENADCTDAVQVATPAHSVTTIAFGEVPATEYTPDKLPEALRTCLGL